MENPQANLRESMFGSTPNQFFRELTPLIALVRLTARRAAARWTFNRNDIGYAESR